MRSLNKYITDEEAIVKLTEELKGKYMQYKRFYDECRKHVCITNQEIFKIVYWDDMCVNKYRKNGQMIVTGVPKPTGENENE